MKEFWKDWENITEFEKKAIKSLIKAKKIILDNVPREELISIYVKGSFPRREMNERSDVDLVPILKSTKTLLKLKKLSNKYCKNIKPKPQLSGYSIWELKRGKRSVAKGLTGNRAGTSRILKHFPHYKLIYGKTIDVSNFPRRSHEHDLRSMVSVFKSLFLPMYKGKELGFEDIVKQVLWLCENEMRFLGKSTPHNWKALDRSIKEKTHIVHQTYKYRLKKPKDKKIRRQYIKRLENYLDKLEKMIK
jgi:predicted nucleotidyltransferase